MFDYSKARLLYMSLEYIKEPSYHDIDYDVLKGNVAILKDHPRQDLPPIVVSGKEGDYKIEDGRHRWIAYKHAERTMLPVIVL